MATQALEKDGVLKKPQTAYWLWLGDNRSRIVTMLATAKGPDVVKKGGELWKTLSDADRQPYETSAKEKKKRTRGSLLPRKGNRRWVTKRLRRPRIMRQRRQI